MGREQRGTPVPWEDSPGRSVEPTSEWQEDGDQLEGGRNNPGERRCALSQGVRQRRAQDSVRPPGGSPSSAIYCVTLDMSPDPRLRFLTSIKQYLPVGLLCAGDNECRPVS